MSVARALRRVAPEQVATAGDAPGPHGWRLLRDLLAMRSNRIALVTRAMREHGDLVQFAIGPRRLLLAAHPDAMRRVLIDNAQNYRKGLGLSDARPLLGTGLLTSEGEQWAARRTALQGALQGEDLDVFASAVVEAARRTAAAWDASGAGGIDLGRDMLRLSLRAFTRGILRLDLGTEEDEVLDDFDAVGAWALRRSVSVIRTPLAFPSRANLTVKKAIARLEKLSSRILEAPRGPESTSGLLATIRALDHGDTTHSAGRDELLTLLLAGHETTGAALAWTWFCLAGNPDADGRCREELETVLGDRAPRPADVPRLPFTRAVFDEACRLYPPVWLIPRKALGADRISGHHVAPGADVLLVVYSLHRHPACWEMPERFDPDRFLTSRVRGGTYLPFGAGPRACLGSRLATLEGVLALAVLARRFHVSCEPIAAPSLNPELTLHFPHAHPAWISPRQPSKAGEASRAPAP